MFAQGLMIFKKMLEEIQGICSVGNSLTDIKEDLETIKNMVN